MKIQQLLSERDNATKRVVAMAEEKRSTKNNDYELLKLRGEVAVLRRNASEASEKAQLTEQKLTMLLSANAQFNGQEAMTISDMKRLCMAVTQYADDNGGQFPTNVVQLTNSLPRSIPRWGDFFGFDFVNVGVVKTDYPRMVALRERLARQAPDGTWRRVYGFVDGSVWAATSYDGNFDAWEKANTYSPPPNQ